MSTKTATKSAVLNVAATISLEDALSLSLQGEDATNRAAVAAHYVITVRKDATIRDYALRSGTLSKTAVGRMVHVGAAIVTIGATCTEQDARNVARALNVLPSAEVKTATDGLKGRALAKTFATLAQKASATLSESRKRAPKTASNGTPSKGKGKGTAPATPATPATPGDAIAGAIAMIKGATAMIRNGAPVTGDSVSALEDATGALITAAREASSNRNGRNGTAATA